MARPLRIEYAGAIYHLTSRGNARAPIFLSDDDRRLFLSLFSEIVVRNQWVCYGYCLMDNHYHLLIETTKPNLSVGMRQLGGIYTQKFNRQHGRVGHLFQGRYKAIIVERESYLLELCRYIVLNPVRAKIVDHPGKYRWSSYNATAGSSDQPPYLHIDWILAQFGGTIMQSRHQYRNFVLAGCGKESPWKNLKSQCVLGGDVLLDRLSPYLQQKKGEFEIPRQERFVDRPLLADLFPSEQSKSDRNHVIAQAHLHYGFSQQEIALQCGLHYSTISRIIQREKRRSKYKT